MSCLNIKNAKKNVIALLTDRNSNNVQIKAVVNSLSQNGNIYHREIQFNFLSKLPNFILMFLPVWLIVNKNDGFNEINHCDIIVSCGRRSLKYSKHLKKNMFPNAKIVHILKPDYFSRGIDTVLLPKHDKSIYNNAKVVRFRGALNDKPSDDFLKEESNKLLAQLDKQYLKSPYIGVYIGGTSKHFIFTRGMAVELMRRINLISKEMNATMLITTSRRTSTKVIKAIKKHINCPYYFHQYKQPNALDQKQEYNPYYGFLALSDYHIITGDSISMISEIMSMQKPLYIFSEGIISGKYSRFQNDLFFSGDAKELTRSTIKLENYQVNLANDMTEISDQILNTLYS